MNAALICAVLLALAVSSASARLLWRHAHQPPARRARAWRIGALLLLQALAALLLYFTLFPPERRAPAAALTVLTARAEALSGISGARLALPEAGVGADTAQAPDLAAALRRRPGTRSLHIVGDGLTERDRDAVRGLALRFSPAPAPAGIVEYWLPPAIGIGQAWQVRGRVQGIDGAVLELRDPAGALVGRSGVPSDGSFALGDSARGAGLSEYRLRLLDGKGKAVETLTVPVAVSRPPELKALSLAGGPNAELKLIRRWALDAGVPLDSRIELGAGLRLQSEGAALSAKRLRELDLLLLDERAWSALSGGEKRELREAVSGGLGLLLRLTGPLSPAAGAEWRALGFDIREAALVQQVSLPEAGDKPLLPALNRRPLNVRSAFANVLLRDGKEAPLALWRGFGRGRLGVIWVTDSYRLALAGFPDAHGRLWSTIASTLARAAVSDSPEAMQPLQWPQRRAVFCFTGPSAEVLTPAAQTVVLQPEAGADGRRCAAFWPVQSGWHRLRADGRQLPFYVHAAGEGRALERQNLQRETRRLVASAPAAGVTGTVPVSGSPWPWFFAWLAAAGALWWLERSRRGGGG